METNLTLRSTLLSRYYTEMKYEESKQRVCDHNVLIFNNEDKNTNIYTDHAFRLLLVHDQHLVLVWYSRFSFIGERTQRS